MLEIMNRATLIILRLTLIILLMGCGDEEQGFPNPLQIEFLTEEEEESSPRGSITGQIIFTDNEGQIRAYALSSSEYVVFQGSSKRVSGKDLVVFVDFPSNNATYVMEDGYFQITDADPGSHELILMRITDAVIRGDPEVLPDGDFAEIDIPTKRWVVTVEPDRNTTMGLLTVAIPDLEWKPGKIGQEIVVPQEPKPPIVPTKPTTKPQVVPPVKPQPIDEEGLWFYYGFDGAEIDPGIVAELSGYEDPGFQDTDAVIAVDGMPEVVPGVFGNAWQFNGVNDKINLNDFEAFERVFDQETVSVWFNADETDRGNNVSMIYEEGGGTNGMCLLVADDKLIAHTRDDCVNTPANEKSLAVPFTDAGNWHHAAIVYDQGTLTLYLDGVARGSLETGYADQTVADTNYIAPISQHTSDAAIGGAQGSSYQGLGDNVSFFAGKLDDFRVYNYAFTPGQVRSLARRLAVEHQDKLAAVWGAVKSEQ